MKILVYGINYYPEPTGIGKYTSEMVDWLAQKEGVQIRVIAAVPYYPQWKIYDGYNNHRYFVSAERNVEVYRCPIWIPKNKSGLQRLLHLASFAISSAPILMRQIWWKPTMIWVCAPSLATVPAAISLAKLTGSAKWLHIQDFEVDVAFDMGMLRGQKLRNFLLWIERRLLLSFDMVSTISNRMLEKLKEKKVGDENRTLLPNWVDVGEISVWTGPNRYREDFLKNGHKCVALFSGTLAQKQDLHLLPEVARHLAVMAPQVMIAVCGDGVMKQKLVQLSAGLKNIVFLPLQPKRNLNELLGAADIQLLPQASEVADLVMPSKLGPMLASGRPVVSTARVGSEVAEILQTCGVLSPPGDAAAMALALAELAASPGQRERFGKLGRAYAQENLSKSRVLERFFSQLVTSTNR